jgi:hypothetical protein
MIDNVATIAFRIPLNRWKKSEATNGGMNKKRMKAKIRLLMEKFVKNIEEWKKYSL